MRVFISKKIRKRELGRAISSDDLAVISRTARLALAVPIPGKGLPPGTRLLKAYGTSPRGPKRVIYLLIVEEEDLFLLFYRDKNDPVGKNASMANKAFRTALSKNLEILEADVRSGDVEELLSASPSSQSGEAKS